MPSGGPDVGEDEAASRAKYPGCLADRLRASLGTRNVVHDKAADDHIDAVVVERQVGDVGSAHLDPVGNALEFGVAQRVLLRVVRLVGPPDVDADGAAVQKQLGNSQQHGAAPTAQVEHCFVAA